MAFQYNLVPNAKDRHESQPYWLIAFVRFKYRNTFDRNYSNDDVLSIIDPGFYKQAPTRTNSIKDAKENIMQMQDLLLVDSDCVNWSVNQSKNSFTSSASFSMLFSKIDYAKELAPDDWVLFWSFDNYQKYIEVKKKVIQGERANFFDDGFRFLGRVGSVRKNQSVNPLSGQLDTKFNVECSAFSEFNSVIYYNPLVAKDYGGNYLLAWENLAGSLNRVITNGNIAAQNIVPLLLKICLGLGPSDKFKGPDINMLTGIASDAVLQANRDMLSTPNTIYRVPNTVGQLLFGKSIKIETYSDILTRYVGIQKYSDRNDSNDKYKGFIPNNIKGSSFLPLQNVASTDARISHYSLDPVTGDYLPMPIHFSNRSVWSILKTFQNEPINEMFNTFRVDPDGYVVPTFIFRQQPFSSNTFVEQTGMGTAFLELPRWYIDKGLVYGYDLGRSNVNRCNYVHIQGVDTTDGNKLNQTLQFTYSKPVVDPADIERSGLKLFNTTINAKVIATLITEKNNPAQYWNNMMADILMSGHLKFNGHISMQGVTEPIAIGDNCVFDDVVYQIEGIVHNGGIDPLGRKTYTTTLQVTNGIHILSENSNGIVYPDLMESDLKIGNRIFEGITEEKG